MIDKNTEFDSYKNKIKPAHIFKLLPNSNMHIGYLEISKSDISNFTNVNSIILRNTEKAQNFDFGSFSYLIFKYQHIKLVYRVTYAEKINQDLLLVHLLKPLDTYDLLSIMHSPSILNTIVVHSTRGAVLKQAEFNPIKPNSLINIYNNYIYTLKTSALNTTKNNN